MVLRPAGNNTFIVVGNCYVHGFGEAFAFLGPLPAPWKLRYRSCHFGGFQARFFNSATSEESVHDPRLGPLPEKWEWMQAQRTREDPYFFEKYRNKETGEVINSDPRMLPKALRARGVELEMITLV
jgi:hypothetical protein